MSRRSEMIQAAQATAELNASTTTERVIRPSINFPPTIVLWSPSYYEANAESGKQAQLSGWSHEVNMYVRVFGDLATKVFNAHDKQTGEPLFSFARVNGEQQLREDGKESKGKPITILVRPNGNGLLFEATEEFPNAYCSANEAAIQRIKPGVPETEIG